MLDRRVPRQVVVDQQPIIIGAIAIKDETAATPHGLSTWKAPQIVRADIAVGKFSRGNKLYANHGSFVNEWKWLKAP